MKNHMLLSLKLVILFTNRYTGRFVLYSIVVLLSSCFKVREPEPSNTQYSQSGWNSPTEIGILVENLSSAVTQPNISNYERCFNPEKFIFEPEPTVPGGSDGIFTDWTFADESAYFINLSNNIISTSLNSLVFTNTKILNTVGFTIDSVEYTADYELILYQTDTISTNKGNLRFVLVRNDNNEFYIYSWQDNKVNDSIPSWTELKANFITQ